MNSVNNILGQKFNYLSIDFEGKDFQEQILNKIALEALKNIDENLDLKENTRTQTKELIDLIENNKLNEIETELGYKFPHKNKSDHWHLTTFFKQKKRTAELLSEQENKTLTEFEKNKIIPVKVLSFIYIPNKILILFCMPECSYQNKYAHITLLVKNVNPYFSNVVLENVYDNQDYFKKDYDAIISSSRGEDEKLVLDSCCCNYSKHCVLDNLDFNEEDCYMYVFDKEKFILNGKMKYNF